MLKRLLYRFYTWKRDKYFGVWLQDGREDTFVKYDEYVQKAHKIYNHA